MQYVLPSSSWKRPAGQSSPEELGRATRAAQTQHAQARAVLYKQRIAALEGEERCRPRRHRQQAAQHLG